MSIKSQWKTSSSSGKITVSQLMNWAPRLRIGLENKDSWGFGIQRLSVKESTGMWPMTFSAMGYKDEEGHWFIGLRMNVDQVSPIKFKRWNESDNVINILTNLMAEHMNEHGCKGDYGVVV